MHRLCPFFLLVLLPIAVTFAEEKKPLTPEEAAKKVNEKVEVEMDVKSTGGKNNHYLNSEADYMSEKNFTIFINADYLDKWEKVGIKNPQEHYKAKKIRVTGTVVLEKKKPWIKVDGPDQIKIIEKDKK